MGRGLKFAPCQGCDDCQTQFSDCGEFAPREHHRLRPKYDRKSGQLTSYECCDCHAEFEVAHG